MTVLQVSAQRHPGLNHLLDKEHELFFLISAFLDYHSLLNHNASFAESLYSLRRVGQDLHRAEERSARGFRSSLEDKSGGQSNQMSNSGIPLPLNQRQRYYSLVLLTLVPFLRSKLDALYAVYRQGQSSRWRETMSGGLQNRADGNSIDNEGEEVDQRDTNAFNTILWTGNHREEPVPGALEEKWQLAVKTVCAIARKAFYQLYPYFYGIHEGSRFVYQLLYLLGKSPYYSPELHLAGVTLARLTGQQAAQEQQRCAQARARKLSKVQQMKAPYFLRVIRLGWLKATTLLTDHTRYALIGSVFAFKLLEWWYTTAEQTLSKSKLLPPPPPPPAIPLAKNGIPLPKDQTKCALCMRTRTNDTIISTSGYVFCYPCAFKYVEKHGHCPVTHVAAQTHHLRRIYKGM